MVTLACEGPVSRLRLAEVKLCARGLSPSCSEQRRPEVRQTRPSNSGPLAGWGEGSFLALAKHSRKPGPRHSLCGFGLGPRQRI